MRAFPQSRIMVLLFVASFGPAMRAQPAVPASNSLHEIAGVVLNTRTGLPIRDAEVTLRRTKDNEYLSEIPTDAEGRFSFPQLPNDKYSLQASHRGYIPAAYDEHENGSTAIVTGEGLVSTGLRFMLAPQAVISGVITDDSGDPVPGATVSLYRQDPRVGFGKATRASGTGADELGNYEIANLAPGSYFLSVTAMPWYAVHRPPQNAAQTKASAAQARSPLDVAYPTTYYPDVADSSFAAPISVGAGEHVSINVTLHPVPAIHVTLQLAAVNGQFSVPQLHRDVFGNSDSVQVSFSSAAGNEPPGGHSIATVEISGIAPGAYEMELAGPNGESNRITSIDLSSDQAVDLSSAAPLAEISGKVAMASGENPPASLVAMLVSQQGQDPASAPVEPNGSFHMHSVRPGAYEFAVYTINIFGYPMTTTHLAASGASLNGHVLTVGSDPVTLSATLADSTASVNGFAKQDGKPASGIFLELIPKNAGAGRAAFSVNQSDSDGSFNFLHILPGEYTLVAIQEGWTLDWSNAAAMAPYLAKGLKVIVPLHSQEINLKDSVEVQPK